MRPCNIVLALLLPLCASASAFNAGKLQFNRISVEDGLSNGSVHKICRDSRDYLWFATSCGLCRWDGCRMRTFLKEDMSLDSNFIANILIDRHGNLYVCTDSGVAVYDAATRSFANLNDLAGTGIRNEVTAIAEDGRGIVWIGVNGQGVYAVDPSDWTSEQNFVEDGLQALPANISALMVDSDHDMAMLGLYSDGLYVADAGMGGFKPFRTDAGLAPFMGKTVKCVIPGDAGEYYVSYSANSVARVNPWTGAFEELDIPIPDKVRLKGMKFVDKHLLAIASNNGIWFYDVRGRQLQNSQWSETDKWTLPGNNVLFVGGDCKDGLLVGTHADGAALSMTSDTGFERVDRCGGISLVGSRVSGFAQDSRGNIYVATEQAGLFAYSEEDGILRRTAWKSGSAPLSGVYADGEWLWLLSAVGIVRIDMGSGVERRYFTEKVDNYTLYRTGDGRLLLGTTLGLMRYDPATDSFRALPELKGRYICDMLEDGKGRMWYATYADGIYVISRDGAVTHLTRENSELPTDRILTLYPDSRGNIWARTWNEGLLRIDDDGMALYTVGEGLSSNIVYGVVEDVLGNMWVTSDKGLSMMGNVDEMVHFTMSDGLLNAGFTARAVLAADSGAILLGSRDGFVRFDPRNYAKDTRVPALEISDMRIANETVSPAEYASLLRPGASGTRSLVLSPKQSSFGFSFSLIDRSTFGGGEVFYMLENYDDSWHNAGPRREASFVKMPPGHYRLLVKGVSAKGIWNTSTPPIEIRVRPSFSQTPFARLLYVLLIALPFAIAVLAYRKSVERRKREKEISMRMELNDEKVDFFMTMAHEIRTPLTLIRAPLDSILDRGGLPQETVEDLALVNRNAAYLTQLIGELLDFTRLERKGYELSCTTLDMVEEVGFILGNYKDAMARKGLELRFEASEGKLDVFADKAGLAKIVNNLLSNALKHASTYISVSIGRSGDDVRVEFANDGDVIPHDMRSRIFESFVQYNGGDGAGKDGFGIGLSVAATLVSLHHGTIGMDDDMTRNNFVLTLPLDMGGHPADAPLLEPSDPTRSTVLVTEDNDQLREYICKKLSSRYNVLSAADGEEAMRIIAGTCRIDMVVTDISMPRMDGMELCRRIKGEFAWSHIMVIILSANLTPRLKVSGMEEGADLIIEKPFSFDYLISCIDGLIHNRQALVEKSRKGDAGAENPGREFSSRDELFVHTLNKCISDNLSDPDFSLEELTGQMKMSKSTLNRKVKDLLGTSPNDYIREKRLVKAAELLATSSDRVNEICWQVGFGTPSYFIKCFRKKYGVSPREYMSGK